MRIPGNSVTEGMIPPLPSLFQRRQSLLCSSATVIDGVVTTIFNATKQHIAQIRGILCVLRDVTFIWLLLRLGFRHAIVRLNSGIMSILNVYTWQKPPTV